MLVVGIVVDWRIGVERGLRQRLAVVERQVERAFYPHIQVNRASVYVTDGEIVVETADVVERDEGWELKGEGERAGGE